MWRWAFGLLRGGGGCGLGGLACVFEMVMAMVVLLYEVIVSMVLVPLLLLVVIVLVSVSNTAVKTVPGGVGPVWVLLYCGINYSYPYTLFSINIMRYFYLFY